MDDNNNIRKNIELSEIENSFIDEKIHSNERIISIEERIISIEERIISFKGYINNLIEEFVKNELHLYADTKIIEDNLTEIMNTCVKGPINACIECGIDMGECNPRQLCGKTYCNNI